MKIKLKANCLAFKQKQRNHIISLEPISKRLTSNSIHKLGMTSLRIDVIGTLLAGNEKRIVMNRQSANRNNSRLIR